MGWMVQGDASLGQAPRGGRWTRGSGRLRPLVFQRRDRARRDQQRDAELAELAIGPHALEDREGVVAAGREVDSPDAEQHGRAASLVAVPSARETTELDAIIVLNAGVVIVEHEVLMGLRGGPWGQGVHCGHRDELLHQVGESPLELPAVRRFFPDDRLPDAVLRRLHGSAFEECRQVVLGLLIGTTAGLVVPEVSQRARNVRRAERRVHHVVDALRGGLPAQDLDAVRRGQRPGFRGLSPRESHKKAHHEAPALARSKDLPPRMDGLARFGRRRELDVPDRLDQNDLSSVQPWTKKEINVAGRNQPSFLKRQKEQQRRARAEEKQLRRLQRRRERAQAAAEPVAVETEIPPVETNEPPTP